MAKKLKITQVKSGIGRIERQRKTLEALGFRKVYQTVIHHDTPSIRGMINKVSHLVEFEEFEEAKEEAAPVEESSEEQEIEAVEQEDVSEETEESEKEEQSEEETEE